MDYKLSTHATLKQRSDPWDFEKDTDAESLEQQMIEIMLTNKGIGLAANQIGIAKRVFVMGHVNEPSLPKPFALFNPTVIEASGEQELYEEGCLSFPNIWLKIRRPKDIAISYYDSKGLKHAMELTGLAARCFQHELDHLDGICFVDKVSPLKLQLALKKSRKLKR
jgi:peptide deformylase